MPVCQKCDTKFPNRAFINGKEQTLHKRKFCLVCSPFGTRHLCGPKSKLGIRMKGNDVEVICTICNKKFITKTATHQCRTCLSKKIRNERKNFAIDYLGGKCLICSYDKCRRALVFHHKDPSKKSFVLSANWEKSWERVKKEVDKCVLLCNRCHEEVHGGVTNLDRWI